jgi:hypothetical protein
MGPIQTDVQVSKRILALLVLLAVLAYGNALSAGFTFDDEPDIRSNPAVTGGLDIIRILASPLPPGDLYRPFTVLTFALNEALTPAQAAPFHAVNILLHATVTLLVFWLAVQIFHSGRIAMIAATLFALHPLHTEAVTGLVGRAEVLAALFGLAALLSGSRADTSTSASRRTALQAISLVCFSLAIMSKESALTLLPLMPLLRVLQRAEPLGRGFRREVCSLDWVPYILCAGVFVALRFYVVQSVPSSHEPELLDNVLAFVPLMVRIRSALGILWDYFGLLNVPLVLAADYSYAQVPIVTSWTDPRCLGGMALVTAAMLVFVRHRHMGIRFAAVFPFITLALTANLLFPIGTIKAERLLYLPSVGWVMLVAFAFDRLLCVRRYRSFALGGLAIVVAAFTARTWIRNQDWRDNVALYRSMARTAPDSAKSRYNLGVALQQQNADEAAMPHFTRALDIYPWAEGAALGMGIAFDRMGATDKAIEWYERALEILPTFDKAHTNLCRAFLTTRRFAAAAAACRDGLRYNPTDANLLKGLGHSLIGMGQTEKGIAVLRRSLALAGHDEPLQTFVAHLEASATSEPRTSMVTVQ